MKLVTFIFASFFLFILTINISGQSKTYYVASNGSDSNAGTSIDQPFLSIPKAYSAAVPGDTIYVRGGTYTLTTTISISKSGTAGSYYYLYAYPGERPILDFSKMAFGSSNRGIKLSGKYWHIKGFDIKGAGDNGMNISGSYNIVEFCALYENQDAGLQLGGGASYNKIINCDSYYNYDAPNGGGNADGFSPKLDVGTGNYFYGCRSWQNSDDGWDGYLRGANDVTTTLENCWTFKNGFLKNGSDPGTKANGNGFKMGGSDDKTLMHNFILKNCLSFDNKVKGFDQNNNKGSMTLYNCTGFRNGTYNFSVSSPLNPGKTLTVINCVSLASQGVTLFGGSTQQNNTWNQGFSVSNSDFVSIDPTAAYGPRNADGSLPEIDFMHLVSTSPLVNAGVDVGLPYNSYAPDLGAFELGGVVSSVTNYNIAPGQFELKQNYPNPFNPATVLSYNLVKSSHVLLEVYDIRGRKVAQLVDGTQQEGSYNINWIARDSYGNQMPSGIYFAKLKTDYGMKIIKMALLK